MSSRMYKATHPKLFDMVMVKINAIFAEKADVSLLEYNLVGMIRFPTGDPQTIVDRIEPLQVSGLEPLRLTRRNLTFEGKSLCEQRYQKSKFVQLVLQLVATEADLVLSHVCKQTKWPTYEDLMNANVGGLTGERKELRLKAIETFKKIGYRSWRITDPSILHPSYLISVGGFCWAVALVRQMEAVLKLHGIISKDTRLSVQDLIDKTPRSEFIDGEGDIASLLVVHHVLTKVGILREQDCPLTFSLVPQLNKPNGPVYMLDDMRVVVEGSGSVGADCCDEYEKHVFEAQLQDELLISPVTASVVWFRSYHGVREDIVFKATVEEIDGYRRRQYLCQLDPEMSPGGEPIHTMLLTGSTNSYMEFQDGDGDVGNGDRGFIRFAREPNAIIEFVRMRVKNRHRPTLEDSD